MVMLRPVSLVGSALVGLVGLGGVLYPALGAFGVALAITLACAIASLEERQNALWRWAGLVWFGLVIIVVMVVMRTPFRLRHAKNTSNQ